MIVRLTSAQIAALDKALTGPLGTWFGKEMEFLHAGHTQFDVRGIPDFWLAMVDDVIRHHLSPGSARPRTATLAAAVKRIVTEVNRYRTHPAFRGECVLGDQSVWLPVWCSYERADLPFMPADDPGYDLWMMQPTVMKQGPHTVTCWALTVLPFPPSNDPVLLPSTYWRFRRALEAPASAPARRSSAPVD